VLRNDNGVFVDINATLIGGANLGIAWGDYDNDGDLDLLLSGNTASLGPKTVLYRNDGGGVFTNVQAPLSGFSCDPPPALVWGDYDNDAIWILS